jgi:PKD repeat protein
MTDIHLLNANELWVSTTSGVAYHSATAGLSWAVLDTESPGFGNYSAVTAVPGGDAWVAGWQGYIDHFTGPPPGPVNQPPVAAFTYPPVGLTLAFSDASTDPDGTVVSWLWDFGDGATSTEQNPTHTFAEEGTYIVSLTVTDDDGAEGMHFEIIAVQAGPGGTFGDFTEVTPFDSLFVTPQDEDFWVSTTAPADYDGDGDLDIAVLGYYVVYHESVEFKLVLLRNDGQLSTTEWEFAYIDVPLNGLSVGASDIAWGDADGDGDQDLVVGTDGAAVLYRNDAGTLVATDTALPAYYESNDQANFDLRSITWADYDNDGDQDLLVPSVIDFEEFTYRTALMRNDGPNGTGGMIFTETDSTFAPTEHAQSAWADYDGDQDLDLLLANLSPLTEDSFIRRYRNDGGGVFVGEDILGDVSVQHGEVQWGDYDADGDLDILVVGQIKEGETFNVVLRVYRNDAETYIPVEVIENVWGDGWLDLLAATWADYDSDGDVDILVAGTYNSGSQIEGRAKIFDNENGVFTDSGNELPAPRASSSRGGSFTWLDLDGEGDLDYFIAGEYFVPGGNGLIEAQMHVYRNDAELENAAPSAPDRVKVIVNGAAASATFTWAPAGDDHTDADAITYDLEIYRNGSPATPRRLPQPGSVSAVTEWTLENLTDGFYQWSVRAVDSAYNGGPAVEGSFVFGDPVDVATISDLPAVFEFQGGTPNPFKAATTFRFALPERANVNLSVYDVTGRLVERVVDEAYEPGRYNVQWHARGVAAGAYFAKLNASSFTKTERIMVVR